MKIALTFIVVLQFYQIALSQMLINEGCNKNYLSIQDEDGDSPDWIELYNLGFDTVDLESYSISDDENFPKKWEFPSTKLAPNQFQIVFCSGKNRKGGDSFQFCLSQQNFNPVNGWNSHNLTNPFYWDGISNLIVNVCSYNNSQYTENSSVRQSLTSFPSTLVSFVDGSPAACSTINGGLYSQRPNMRFNGISIGNGSIINGNTEYPAPYGNWYWGARHQLLFLASELQNAGLTAGPITSLAFDVASTSSEFYNYVDFSITETELTELSSEFIPTSGYQLHTNFKLDGLGEKVYLFRPDELEIDRLTIESPARDISLGRFENGSSTLKWLIPTPGSSNNSSFTYTDTLKKPIISLASGVYEANQYLHIYNPNQSIPSKIVYSVDGSTPTINSIQYLDSILVTANTVLRAKIFPLNSDGEYLPSDNTVATYLFNISHTTPILLVTTDENNLYGAQGIFDNYNSDWKKPAHAAYLSEQAGHPLEFQTNTGIRPDGGAGGSRSQPQHSFRLSFADGALGSKPIEYPLIPDRPNRNTYSDVYLRNGSNQFLSLPYKDACQVRMMSEGTKTYYSAYRPITVYINGQYFGLYELREKFNKEYFQVHDGANPDSIELLSMSYFYNLVLRAVEGDIDNFYNSYDSLVSLNFMDTNYITKADQYFDMAHYTDYVIGESWMGNVDWPNNNIKIYRSDKTQNRWRFGLIDLELSLQPNGWTSCTDNHIRFMLDRDPSIPYINIWLRSINNTRYRNYFINRFADLMNTSYRLDKLLDKEQEFYEGMLPEMPLEFERWGDPNNIQGQMAQFTQNHNTFRSELSCRTSVVRNNLISEFGLTKKVSLNLDVFPDSTGKIKINTVIPEIFPWSGVYFDGVPVKMTAIADSGYQFSHWEPNLFITDTLNPVIDVNITQNKDFKAHFKVIPPKPDGDEIHFSIFPNPTSFELILQHDNKTLAKDCSYEIYDLHGRKICGGAILNTSLQTNIDVSNLRSTMYFLTIKQNEDLIDTIRFVKN